MEKEKQLVMTILVGDNIISALGFSSEENFSNVKRGKSGLRLFDDKFDFSEPVIASEINDCLLEDTFNSITPATLVKEQNIKYTKLEKASIVSVYNSLKNTNIDPSDDKTLFILSTTKGNVFLLDPSNRTGYDPQQLYLWRSAELISRFFGNKNTPLVVSNACISGASAIIAAQRALKSKRYETVIVIGADMLSQFVITGFQSFKALSQEFCKPFDVNRNGLNIGEAAATLILTERDEIQSGDIEFTCGAIRNDANHISGPSRTGEGSFLALRKTLENVDIDDLAFINAHGTATPYNDEMESVSLTRAGLQNVPLNSLKGYFGHTLGAAGVLESILSAYALKEGVILPTYGFDTLGVTNKLNVVKQLTPTHKKRFVKLMSGFGGCNTAMLYTKH
jgi:3-oxoacyl-[acyl-carrier-protein] synthase-1